MAEVLTWHNQENYSTIIQTAVQTLSEGQLVLFPTETEYTLAASAHIPEAIEKLSKFRPSSMEPPTLGVSGWEEAVRLHPRMSILGRRLTRRCWPGEVSLVFKTPVEEETFESLPESIRQHVGARGQVAFRCPGHPAIFHTLSSLSSPVVLAPVRVEAAENLHAVVGEQAALIVEDGPAPAEKRPSVVQIDGNRWEMLEEGVVPATQIKLQTACLIVFVCTGNTCRSPLAESLCKKRLADHLNCTVEELPDRGYVLFSAGVAAGGGEPASAEAVEIAREFGADLGNHRSTPFDTHLAEQADYLICMTQGHLRTLVAYFERFGCEPRLLNLDGKDLADPIGQDQSVYRECAQQIWSDLESFVSQLTS